MFSAKRQRLLFSFSKRAYTPILHRTASGYVKLFRYVFIPVYSSYLYRVDCLFSYSERTNKRIEKKKIACFSKNNVTHTIRDTAGDYWFQCQIYAKPDPHGSGLGRLQSLQRVKRVDARCGACGWTCSNTIIIIIYVYTSAAPGKDRILVFLPSRS